MNQTFEQLKQHNWTNFITHHLRNWYGSWTIYSPEGEVMESFVGSRCSIINPEQTQITQTNVYMYDNGTEEEKVFHNTPNSLINGLADQTAQASFMYMFEQGSAIWTVNRFEPGELFAVEFWFRYQELRHSLLVVYNSDGKLTKTVSVREEDLQKPCDHWTLNPQLIPHRDIINGEEGLAITLTPVTQLSQPRPTHLAWEYPDHQTFYYPDGISLSYPPKLKPEMSLVVIGDWQVNPNIRQQLLVDYNSSGELSGLTLKSNQPEMER
ncbi:MAG: DUF3598 family protein [Moorea sp. SIOASIH]|uniref:DUF3598 family protein n=1 Tax=Moorena sp. SIOASIH TaxID=2607817 RepID=UPI0013BA0399|nr:DUF3598 family protein [Moorena sp. SIOASIH]NEO37314.1 DUF3598 family protein [Moorena sp. SIOASIH]